MLSLREFCIALYLMERYREGRSLPAVLPNNILFDETVPPRTSQPQSSYGNVNWGATSGLRQQLGVAGAQSVAPFTPPGQVTTSKADGAMQGYQQNAKVPVLENPLMNRLSNGERNSQKSKFEEVEDSGKKVEGTQNMILDSKEKIEFYRTKMQELVLYKSRCDNRLNEITERAFVDKREAELLGKKYEEKYKQVAEIASKLAVEEAKFRDVQERKVELHQAILKMENGGSADGILQVRADRIQSDLEGLMKGLSECCKKHGVDVKSTTMIELPIGWQPGIQEGAADWDEDWDKFEDEGFSFVKDLSLDAHNGIYSPEQKSSSVWTDKASPNGSLTPDSLSNAEDKFEKPSSAVEHVLEHESTYTQSEDDLAGSPPRSPPGKAAPGSLFQEFAESHSGKSTELDAEIHQSFDEPSWGAFDTNDDTDSVWGFNPVNTRVSDLEKPRENYFFGSGDSSVNPIRTESPSTDSMFQKKSPFTFVDSLPGTPVSKSGNSPPRYSGGSGDHFFDNFSRFDSFSTHDGGFSTVPDSLTRFDSINSSRDFGRRETLTRFDSVNSTRDFGHIPGFSSFDDTDPFGSTGPFKVSSESQTPKKSSDNWSSF